MLRLQVVPYTSHLKGFQQDFTGVVALAALNKDKQP